MIPALLTWLVLFAALFAIAGFVAVIARGFSGRSWSNSAILRASSALAFLVSSAIWIMVIVTN